MKNLFIINLQPTDTVINNSVANLARKPSGTYTVAFSGTLSHVPSRLVAHKVYLCGHGGPNLLGTDGPAYLAKRILTYENLRQAEKIVLVMCGEPSLEAATIFGREMRAGDELDGRILAPPYTGEIYAYSAELSVASVTDNRDRHLGRKRLLMDGTWVPAIAGKEMI